MQSDCSIVESKEGQEIILRYERLINILNEKETKLYDEWTLVVPRSVDKGLQRHLLTRDRGSILLMVNFDSDLLAVLKEVNYLKQIKHNNIPIVALQVCRRNISFNLLNIINNKY